MQRNQSCQTKPKNFYIFLLIFNYFIKSTGNTGKYLKTLDFIDINQASSSGIKWFHWQSPSLLHITNLDRALPHNLALYFPDFYYSN